MVPDPSLPEPEPEPELNMAVVQKQSNLVLKRSLSKHVHHVHSIGFQCDIVPDHKSPSNPFQSLKGLDTLSNCRTSGHQNWVFETHFQGINYTSNF